MLAVFGNQKGMYAQMANYVRFEGHANDILFPDYNEKLAKELIKETWIRSEIGRRDFGNMLKSEPWYTTLFLNSNAAP